MSIGPIASASATLPPVRRLVDFATAQDIRETTLASPENIERMFQTLESFANDSRALLEGAASGLAHSRAAVQRISDFIAALPRNTLAEERSSWQNELRAEHTSVAYYRSQIAWYRAQGEDPGMSTIFKMLSVILGKSVDEVKAMSQDRLDRRA